MQDKDKLIRALGLFTISGYLWLIFGVYWMITLISAIVDHSILGGVVSIIFLWYTSWRSTENKRQLIAIKKQLRE